MDADTDERLIDRFRSTGELKFFDKLVSRHVEWVRNTVYPMVLNHADADDLTQEVFLRVVRSLERYEGRSRFSTWLYRIAMNTTYRFLERRGRVRHESDGVLDRHPDPSAGPAERLVWSERDGHMGQALAKLSPTLRAAIVLTAIQGLDVREAAAVEGCLTATMYWRVHEARKTLRRLLRTEGAVESDAVTGIAERTN